MLKALRDDEQYQQIGLQTIGTYPSNKDILLHLLLLCLLRPCFAHAKQVLTAGSVASLTGRVALPSDKVVAKHRVQTDGITNLLLLTLHAKQVLCNNWYAPLLSNT